MNFTFRKYEIQFIPKTSFKHALLCLEYPRVALAVGVEKWIQEELEFEPPIMTRLKSNLTNYLEDRQIPSSPFYELIYTMDHNFIDIFFDEQHLQNVIAIIDIHNI